MIGSPRLTPRLLWIIVAAVATGLLLIWWTGLGATPTTSDQAAGDGGEVGLTLYPPGSRAQAPDLRGDTLEGEPFVLSDLKEHVVVINVWGSWCSPCRAEAPDLARAARETHAQGVRFVGIDTRDSLAAARAFTESFDIPYPSVVDTDGQKVLALGGVIPVSAVPSTVVVDPAGGIAARVIGRVDYTTLRGVLDDVLAESDGQPTS